MTELHNFPSAKIKLILPPINSILSKGYPYFENRLKYQLQKQSISPKLITCCFSLETWHINARVFFTGRLHAISLSEDTNDKICKNPEKKDWLSESKGLARMTLVPITCSSVVN